jgi:hypothetical protein
MLSQARHWVEMSGQIHVPAALPSRKATPVPIGYEAKCASRAGLDAVARRKISIPNRNRSLDTIPIELLQVPQTTKQLILIS